MDERLERQLDFIRQLDRLKNVQRQTWLMDTSRKENSPSTMAITAMCQECSAEFSLRLVSISQVCRRTLLSRSSSRIKSS